MKSKSSARLSVVSTFAAALLATSSCSTLQPRPEISGEAEAALQAMAGKLEGTRQFQFQASRELDEKLAASSGLARKGTVTAFVSRPNRFFGTLEGPAESDALYFDGSAVTLFDRKADSYCILPVKKRTIDGAIDEIHARFGFAPPLADFIVEDLYDSMTGNMDKGEVAGRETVRGDECDHLVFTGKEIDWELWLGTEDKLPRRYVITAKQLDGKPQLVAEFSRWHLNRTIPEDTFHFTAPPGSHQVEHLSIEEAAAALMEIERPTSEKSE